MRAAAHSGLVTSRREKEEKRSKESEESLEESVLCHYKGQILQGTAWALRCSLPLDASLVHQPWSCLVYCVLLCKVSRWCALLWLSQQPPGWQEQFSAGIKVRLRHTSSHQDHHRQCAVYLSSWSHCPTHSVCSMSLCSRHSCTVTVQTVLSYGFCLGLCTPLGVCFFDVQTIAVLPVPGGALQLGSIFMVRQSPQIATNHHLSWAGFGCFVFCAP